MTTEADFQDKIVAAASIWGWEVFHVRPGRTQTGWATPIQYHGKGFPDLVMVHPDLGVLFREVKSDTGRLTDAQQHWGDLLGAAGADWAVWRPADWRNIISELSPTPVETTP